MKRRGMIGAVAAASALALVMTGVAVQQGMEARRYRRRLEYNWQEAMGQLASSASAVAVDLEKACYAGTSAGLSETAARLWRECGTAKAALSALPLREAGLEKTGLFFSQVGDYAMAMARQAGRSSAVDEEQRDRLMELLPYARAVAEQTDRLEAGVLSGEILTDGLALGWMEEDDAEEVLEWEEEEDAAPALAADTPAVAAEDEPAEPAGGVGEAAFASMEEGFAGYPRLIYDGPFSSHLQEQEPRGISRESHISRQQARGTAARIMGAEQAALQEAGDENGSIPAYLFTFGEQAAAITKQGGHLLYLMDGHTPGGQTIPEEQGQEIAQSFLASLGYRDMESSYHQMEDNICVYNFAYTQNGVTCYTDLIKVGVAMDTGKVVQLDARGYLTNHEARTLPAPDLSAGEARASLSPVLRPMDSRLALIPSAGGEELLCWEHRCSGAEGRQVLVYHNAATGHEEQILLLEIGENGTLTV